MGQERGCPEILYHYGVLKSSFSWLHLTDFHYGLKGQDCLWPTLREPFLDSLAEVHKRCGPWDAVLFTGDLVQSGETAQFEEMQAEVLDPLWEKLRELGLGSAVLLAVPGNHDLYRPNPNEDNAAIDAFLKKDGFQDIAAKFWDRPAGPYRGVINEASASAGGCEVRCPARRLLGDASGRWAPHRHRGVEHHVPPIGRRKLRGPAGLGCPPASR